MSEEVLAVRLLEVLSPTDPTLAAFGFAALLAGLARLAYTRRTARWPRTLGTVLSSEVLTRPGRFGLPAPSLDVSYEYRVGATTYRAVPVAISRASKRGRRALRWATSPSGVSPEALSGCTIIRAAHPSQYSTLARIT